MTDAIQVRRFDQPDEKLDMGKAGGIDIVRLDDGTAGMHAVFHPGWTWEKDEKPLLGGPDTCPMRHVGYCIGGTLAVRMVESGRETRIERGDFFNIPPGHDGYVEGDEPVEVILFGAPEAAH